MSAFLFASLVLFVASFLQGLTGFGSALIAVPLLSYVIDIKTVVPFCTLCGVLMNLKMTHNLWANIDRKKITPLIIGSLPGTFFGTLFLKEVDGDIIRLFLGVLITAFSAYSLLTRPRKYNISPRWGYFSGFMTGAISASVSAGGPPTIIYSTLIGWDKDDFKATLASFFFVAGVMSVIGHLVSGLTTMYAFELFLASSIPVLAGIYCGNRLSRRISEGIYKRIVMILLVFMGMMLIFQNV